MLDLAEALATTRPPSVLALFDLSRLVEHERALGERSGEALISRLAMRLARAVGRSGACYRAREDESARTCTCRSRSPLRFSRLLPRLSPTR